MMNSFAAETQQLSGRSDSEEIINPNNIIPVDESYIVQKFTETNEESELALKSEVESVALSRFQTIEAQNNNSLLTLSRKNNQENQQENQGQGQLAVPSTKHTIIQQRSSFQRQNCLRLSTINEDEQVEPAEQITEQPHFLEFPNSQNEIQVSHFNHYQIPAEQEFNQMLSIPDEEVNIDSMEGIGHQVIVTQLGTPLNTNQGVNNNLFGYSKDSRQHQNINRVALLMGDVNSQQIQPSENQFDFTNSSFQQYSGLQIENQDILSKQKHLQNAARLFGNGNQLFKKPTADLHESIFMSDRCSQNLDGAENNSNMLRVASISGGPNMLAGGLHIKTRRRQVSGKSIGNYQYFDNQAEDSRNKGSHQNSDEIHDAVSHDQSRGVNDHQIKIDKIDGTGKNIVDNSNMQNQFSLGPSHVSGVGGLPPPLPTKPKLYQNQLLATSQEIGKAREQFLFNNDPAAPQFKSNSNQKKRTLKELQTLKNNNESEADVSDIDIENCSNLDEESSSEGSYMEGGFTSNNQSVGESKKTDGQLAFVIAQETGGKGVSSSEIHSAKIDEKPELKPIRQQSVQGGSKDVEIPPKENIEQIIESAAHLEGNSNKPEEGEEEMKKLQLVGKQESANDQSMSDGKNSYQMIKLVNARKLRSFDKKSMFIFSQNSTMRIWCYILLHNVYYEWFMKFFVLANCFILAFYDFEYQSNKLKHLEPFTVDSLKVFAPHLFNIDQANIFFTAIYLIDSLIAGVAYGVFMHKKSYLRVGWNWINFAAILIGLVECVVSPMRSSTLRSLRSIFIPMRVVNAMPSVKTLIQSLIGSLPEFGNVAIFMVFVFVLFATMGLQQYNGSIYNTCRFQKTPTEVSPGVFTWKSDLSFQRVCSKTEIGNFVCPKHQYCGNPDEYESITLESEKIYNREYLNFGVTNFDNLATSMLTVFQMITSETWYSQIVNLSDLDIPIIAIIYCFAVIIVGQFFLLNLILAVMIEAFKKSHERQLQEALEILEMKQDDPSSPDEDDSEDNEEYDYYEEDEEQAQSFQANQQQSNLKQIEGIDETGGLITGENERGAAKSLEEDLITGQNENLLLGRFKTSFFGNRSGQKANNSESFNSPATEGQDGKGDNSIGGASIHRTKTTVEGKRNLRSIFQKGAKSFMQKKKDNPIQEDGRQIERFRTGELGSSGLRKSMTVRNIVRPKKAPQVSQSMAPAKRMADLIAPNKQLEEDQKKYENEDFSVFIKELVMKRRIVNMFMKAKNPYLKMQTRKEKANEMAARAEAEQEDEIKVKQIEQVQKQNQSPPQIRENESLRNSGLLQSPNNQRSGLQLRSGVQQRSAMQQSSSVQPKRPQFINIVVEEMKEQSEQKISTPNISIRQDNQQNQLIGKQQVSKASDNKRGMFGSSNLKAKQFNRAAANQLGQIFDQELGFGAENDRDLSSRNLLGVSARDQDVNTSFAMLKPNIGSKHAIEGGSSNAVNKTFNRLQTSNQPKMIEVVQHVLQNPSVLKAGIKKFKTGAANIQDDFVSQFNSNAVGSFGKKSKRIKQAKKTKRKKSETTMEQQFKSGIQARSIEDDSSTIAKIAPGKTFDGIGNTIVDTIVGVAPVLVAEDPDDDNKVQRTSDAQTNRILDVLMTNFGASIRKKILEMQRLAELQQSKQYQRRANSRFIDLCCKIVENEIFSAFMFLCILANHINICSDQYPFSKQRNQSIETMNIFTVLIFLAEMIIRMTAESFQEYIKISKLNQFDTFIVCVGLIDIFVANIFLSDEMKTFSMAITVLRALRIIRFLKFPRYWQSFRILLENLFETLQNIKSFAILLLMALFIYSLLGLEFFALKAKINPLTKAIDPKNGHSPNYHFDDFMQSLFTTFVIFTNDGQSLIYYNFYRAVSPYFATIWWLTFMILTQKVLLNVFLAILLEKFEEADSRQNIIAEKENENEETEKSGLQRIKETIKEKYQMFLMKLKQPSNLAAGKTVPSEQNSQELKMMKSLTRELASIYNKMNIEESPIQGKSLYLFDSDIYLRHFLFKIVSHPKYDAVIVFCILISSILLALDTPTLDPNGTSKKAIYWIDFATIVVFTLEFIIKIITFGFFLNGKYSYLNGMWNILDFVILIFSYLCLTSLVDTFKVVKTFRILRSLRLIGRNEGLKVAVRALLFAIPNILNITVIMLLFHSFFGVIAVSHFKGKMHYCTNQYKNLNVYSKWECINMGGLWVNRLYNFDNMVNAFISLFVMSTTAGWSDVVVQTITNSEIDYIGNEQARPAAWTLFFMFYMIVAHFFFLNLFIVVVISTFKSEQNRVGGGDLLTGKQKEWIDLRLLILRSQPIKKLKPPESKWRIFFYKIQHHRHFEKFIQVSIILNTIVLMIKWYRQPSSVDTITEMINLVFTVIFISEAFIRITGTGFITYFKDGWNVFDFIIALGSVVSILVSQISEVEIKAVTLLRAFRILRLLRLLKRGGKSLYLIFNTFVITMQSLANIGGLLLLMMYIYSIIGMIYFGEQKRNSTMNAYINFESFTSAFITLFTVATVDSWNYTMMSFSYVFSPANQCLENPNYQDYKDNNYEMIGCGNPQNTLAFFISFMFLVSLVFLKLFIAIILEGYKETQTQDTRLFNSDMNQHFREVWADFDPDATTFIYLRDIRNFLFKLGAPLGFDDSFHESRFLQDKFIASLELPTYHNFQSYQFLDILDALSFRLMVLDHINKMQEENELQKQQTALQNNNKTTSSQQQNGATNNAHEQLFEIDEREIKGKIEHEVNRLLFQKQSENIVAFKELWEKEQKKKQNREKNKDESGLTSTHHMALEAVIRKIKVILHDRREARRMAEEAAEKRRRQQEEEDRLAILRDGIDPSFSAISIQPSKAKQLQSGANPNHQDVQGSDSKRLGFFKRFTQKVNEMAGNSKSLI